MAGGWAWSLGTVIVLWKEKLVTLEKDLGPGRSFKGVTEQEEVKLTVGLAARPL